MMEMYQDPEIQASMMAGNIVPRPDSFKETVRSWEKNPLFVAIVDKETGKFIGNVSLRSGELPGELELAMKVKKQEWGQGYGKEILFWTIQHAFQSVILLISLLKACIAEVALLDGCRVCIVSRSVCLKATRAPSPCTRARRSNPPYLPAKILKKHRGFVQEGIKRRARWANGKWEDVILMAMVEDEFDTSRARPHTA